MILTVKDVMNIEPFAQSVLVAGKNGLDRPVESTNVQEVPNVVHWLHGKEIIFTSGFAFRDAERGCILIQELNDIGCAALAIKLGQYLQKIPVEMIQLADKLNFPLFSLPSYMPYMDCMIPIYEKINKEQLYTMKQIVSANEELKKVMLQNAGLSGICQALEKKLHDTVFIATIEGTILACCPNDDESKELITFWKDTCRSNDFRIRNMTPNKCNFLHCGDKKYLTCIPICVSEEILGYLNLGAAKQLDQIEIVALDNASSLIAIEILKEQAVINQEEHVKQQLLEDVLLNRYQDKETILLRGRYNNFWFDRQYQLFVINSSADKADFIAFKGSDPQTLCKESMRSINLPCLFMNNKLSGITGIVNVKDQNEIDHLRKSLNKLLKELNDGFTDIQFSAGISSFGSDIDTASDLWEEAKVACRTACQMRITSSRSNPVASFSDLGCLCFLQECSKSQTMKNFYHKYMNPLLEYDRNNNSELLKTLECFFTCNMNVKETSECLFIHKNSAAYRLKKIESIIGGSLSDSQVAFNLQLCIKLRNLINE